MTKRLRLASAVIFLLSSLAFLSVSSGYGSERMQPWPIEPRPLSYPQFPTKGDLGFCTIQYDSGWVAWYSYEWEPGWGVAVYMDPQFCGFDSTYPFKLTNVHFHLLDQPDFFIWPAEIKVNIREVFANEDTLMPGSLLHSKGFTVSADSAYDTLTHRNPINLSLDTVFCVNDVFFLEIVYTAGDKFSIPSLVMSDTTDRPDTNENWLVRGTQYIEWYDGWYEPMPGRAIIRVTGYPQAIDCEICWRWMPKATKAPGGTPDFDQYQFGSDSVSLCGPTALANSLVWLDAIPSITNPDSLIRLLSVYLHTNPSAGGGTIVDSIKLGLDSLFAEYDLNLYDTVFQNPTFRQISDSLEESVSSLLLLGFWQRIGETWYRIGGHYVSAAGACDFYSWIAISDPASDNTETGAKGRILPPHDPHPDDDTLHNIKGFVSHDAYVSGTLDIDPYGTALWELTAFDGDSLPRLSEFEGQNFQPDQEQYAHAYDPAESLFVVVEYAVMILQKPTLVEGEDETIPSSFELFQSYPNPFNNTTAIKYRLQKTADVSLVIYNVLGQKVRTLVEEEKQRGAVTVIWDGKDEQGKDLSSGIYFYRLTAGEVSQTRKMVLLK